MPTISFILIFYVAVKVIDCQECVHEMLDSPGIFNFIMKPVFSEKSMRKICHSWIFLPPKPSIIKDDDLFLALVEIKNLEYKDDDDQMFLPKGTASRVQEQSRFCRTFTSIGSNKRSTCLRQILNSSCPSVTLEETTFPVTMTIESFPSRIGATESFAYTQFQGSYNFFFCKATENISKIQEKNNLRKVSVLQKTNNATNAMGIFGIMIIVGGVLSGLYLQTVVKHIKIIKKKQFIECENSQTKQIIAEEKTYKDLQP